VSDALFQIPEIADELASIHDEHQYLNRLFEYFWLKKDIREEQTLDHYNELLERSKKLHYKYGIAFSLLLISNFYYYENLDKAMQFARESNHLFTELDDKKGIANSCVSLSFNLKGNGDFDQALEAIHRAITSSTEGNCYDEMMLAQYALGVFHFDMKDYKAALAAYADASQVLDKVRDLNLAARVEGGMGSAYQMLGDHEKATYHINQSLEYYKKIDNHLGESRAYNDLGLIEKARSHYERAEEYFMKSLKLREELNSRTIMHSSYLALCDLYLLQNENEKALTSAMHALECAMDASSKPKVFQTHQRLAEIYKKMNDPWKALGHFEKFLKLKEDVLGEEMNNKIKQLQTKFATVNAEKESEINRLKNVELKNTLDELKAAQSQLVQTEKMASLGQLTSGIAHEINNPINFVSANINPLKRNFEELIQALKNSNGTLSDDLNYTIEESQLLLSGIEEGSKRTAEIVKGLRNFSRLDEDVLKLSDINEGIESTLVLVQNKMNQHNIEVIKSLGDIPQIECYPGQLNQVWMNLLTNAIDAVGSDAPNKTGERKIFVTTDAIPIDRDGIGSVRVSIRDTGNGISDEVKQKIFDPFFTTKDVGKGTGLGLSISYGIIEKHNGKIEVKSEVGKGTEFIIILPYDEK